MRGDALPVIDSLGVQGDRLGGGVSYREGGDAAEIITPQMSTAT